MSKARKSLEVSSGDVLPVAKRKETFTAFGQYLDTTIRTLDAENYRRESRNIHEDHRHRSPGAREHNPQRGV